MVENTSELFKHYKYDFVIPIYTVGIYLAFNQLYEQSIMANTFYYAKLIKGHLSGLMVFHTSKIRE